MENPERKQTVDERSRTRTGALDAALRAELDAIGTRGLSRRLRRVEGRAGARMRVDGREVLNFAGANYLDLAGDPRVIAAAQAALDDEGCAAGGARLIAGNRAGHEALETELAERAGLPAALVFSTGYMANLGLITALAGPDDVIVSDALNHASIIDACRLSRAQTRVFAHGDADDLRRVAAGLSGFRRRLLVTDGVYSMDGDVAPLAELVPIARAHDMAVIVDDAHGFGVLGADGRGAVEACGVEVDAVIGNLGKSLGSFGAFVAGSALLREWLVQASRPFIFTCALEPGAVAAARAALAIARDEPERRSLVLERARQLRAGLAREGFDVGASTTHIVPAIVGDNRAVMRLCEAALERGLYAQGIRYPSVPEGTARLRFTLMSSHTPDDVDLAVDTFARLRKDLL